MKGAEIMTTDQQTEGGHEGSKGSYTSNNLR